MKTLAILAPILLLFFVSAFAQTSDDELTFGVAACKENHYKRAIQHFRGATELDPDNIKAHLYLATTCVSGYISGVDSDDNKEKAIASEFRQHPEAQ